MVHLLYSQTLGLVLRSGEVELTDENKVIGDA